MSRGTGLAVAALASVLAASGCSPAVTAPANDPARVDAPTGRLAGPPAALRAGVATDVAAPTPAPAPAPVHDHGQH